MEQYKKINTHREISDSEVCFNKDNLIFENKIAKEWLNTTEAANYLNITENALRILVYKRQVHFFKYRSRLRFRKEDLCCLLVKGV